jgi:chromate reductase, NAD(P)H dehydrogenase (quinone)
MSSTEVRALAIVGSLRRGSYNSQLAQSLAARAPDGFVVDVYNDLHAVPLFNEDLELAPPAGVTALRTAVAAADALIIVTPEYNQSIPAVTKNVVDWLSRGTADSLTRKAVGILGATRGPWGTRLSQAALRHTLAACEALVMPAPQVYVRSAAESFDATGALIDARLDASLQAYLQAFREWVLGTRPGGQT